MIDSSSDVRLQKISSVINGIYGCSSLQCIRSVPCFKVQRAAALVASVIIVQTWLYHLNVPVAELFPDKVINLLNCDTELIFIQVLRYFFCKAYLPWRGSTYPLQSESLGSICSGISCLFHIHHNETGCIPYFICKVPGWLLHAPYRNAYRFPVHCRSSESGAEHLHRTCQ